MDTNTSPRKIHFSGITQEIKDIIGAGILLALAVVMIAYSFFIRKTAVSKIGSGFFPRMIGILLLVIGIVLLADAVKRHLACRKGTDAGKAAVCADVDFDLSVILTPLYILAYFALVVPLGFLIATPAYLTLQIRALFVGSNQRPFAIAAGSIIFTVLVYLLFRFAFNLYLPAGFIAGLING